MRRRMGIILTIKDMQILNVALLDAASGQEKLAKNLKIPDILSWEMKELQQRLNAYVYQCRYAGMLEEEIFLTAAELPERIKNRQESGKISVP
jgi:hypothetical protein